MSLESRRAGGLFRPWREFEVDRLRHNSGEELRLSIVHMREGSPAALELRQWDVRDGGDGKPTSHCIRLAAKFAPWLIDAITRAALETANAEDLTKGN